MKKKIGNSRAKKVAIALSKHRMRAHAHIHTHTPALSWQATAVKVTWSPNGNWKERAATPDVVSHPVNVESALNEGTCVGTVDKPGQSDECMLRSNNVFQIPGI